MCCLDVFLLHGFCMTPRTAIFVSALDERTNECFKFVAGVDPRVRLLNLSCIDPEQGRSTYSCFNMLLFWGRGVGGWWRIRPRKSKCRRAISASAVVNAVGGAALKHGLPYCRAKFLGFVHQREGSSALTSGIVSLKYRGV